MKKRSKQEYLPYRSTWDSTGRVGACPAELAQALHAAWDRMGVAENYRVRVMDTRRTPSEWASFGMVVGRALAVMGIATSDLTRPLFNSPTGSTREGRNSRVASAG